MLSENLTGRRQQNAATRALEQHYPGDGFHTSNQAANRRLWNPQGNGRFGNTTRLSNLEEQPELMHREVILHWIGQRYP